MLLGLLGIAAVTGWAVARDRGDRAPDQAERLSDRVLMGVVTRIDEKTVYMEPTLPPHVHDMLIERGWQPPEQPGEVAVNITESTRFCGTDETTKHGAFAAGDEIVVLTKPAATSEGRDAMVIADKEFARKFIGREGRKHRKRSQERRPVRPLFGEIVALTSDSVTLSLEIPDFVQLKLEERGLAPPDEMPHEITLTLSDNAKFFVQGDEATGIPFVVGDEVAVMAGPSAGDAPAVWIMSDYESARMRMAEREARWGGSRTDDTPPR
jgi:hypothetical protein